MKRLFYTGVLFITVFVLPWWAFAALGVVGCFLFRNYYDVIAASFIYDVTFGTAGVSFLGHQFVFTMVSLMLMLLIEESKYQLIIYKK